MSEFKPKVWMTCPVCGKPSPMPDPDAREWVGLTDEDIANVMGFGQYTATSTQITLTHAARAIEAKLREKNR